MDFDALDKQRYKATLILMLTDLSLQSDSSMMTTIAVERVLI